MRKAWFYYGVAIAICIFLLTFGIIFNGSTITPFQAGTMFILATVGSLCAIRGAHLHARHVSEEYDDKH